MLNSDKAFVDFIQDRTTEIGNDLLVRHDEYKSLFANSLELLGSIKDALPTDIESVLSSYEEVQALLLGIAMDSAYKAGLKDGLNS